MNEAATPFATPAVPVLVTERLVLSAPVLADFEHAAAYHASDRAVWEGGPHHRHHAWRIWAADVALWMLKGYGPFRVADRETGDWVGEVGIYHGDEFPEPELGWMVAPQAEGRGIAREAAGAVMDWARKTFGWDDIVNIIDPKNQRSLALALRLGGRVDARRPGIDAGDVVIVHDLRGRG
ncbi:GNAT family N-acetyltransferase [Pararhodobacter marinus]|uniref:N-acetyltransferase n=1 Tax=Pararhodobacter marinus TaxID=2184063 RepID=A0A2U2C662_9RHOB|nr:GNAT family N-acetyltransferase [Pararhodobacter marinus]PWE27370.1 N-acetyltransferase [Pararhodobacter marinus]